MNKRLEELAEQAGFGWDDKYHWYVGNEQMKKFAELIVRECAGLSVNSQYANTKSEYYEGFNEALVYIGNKIKEHFGVE